MEKNKFLEYIEKHKGAFIGGILGFIAALVIIQFGFVKAVFIVGLVLLGYYLGKNTQREKGFIKKLVKNLLEKI